MYKLPSVYSSLNVYISLFYICIFPLTYRYFLQYVLVHSNCTHSSMRTPLRVYSFSVCTSAFLMYHLCVLWSLKVDLGVLHGFFRLLFWWGRAAPLGNSGLNLTPFCEGKSEDIRPELTSLFKGKVRKEHSYKRCAVICARKTRDLGEGIYE